MKVYVEDNSGGGINLYRVIVEGEQYDIMISRDRLTFNEQRDIAAGYREALENYNDH